MLHLFKEETSGDTYAAHDLAEAKRLMLLTDEDAEPTEWTEIPDDRLITTDNDGEKVSKTAAQWASEIGTPGYAFGEHY